MSAQTSVCEGTKSPGQLAYEEDVRRKPNYSTGLPRLAWEDLPEWAHQTWDAYPTPRSYI